MIALKSYATSNVVKYSIQFHQLSLLTSIGAKSVILLSDPAKFRSNWINALLGSNPRIFKFPPFHVRQDHHRISKQAMKPDESGFAALKIIREFKRKMKPIVTPQRNRKFLLISLDNVNNYTISKV